METPSFESRLARLNSSTRSGASGGWRIYWMQSAQRCRDNMALNWAASRCAADGANLAVAFFLSTTYPGANLRHFWFMIQGLGETAAELERMNIPFRIIAAPPWEVLPLFNDLTEVVTDRGYLRHLRLWRKKVASRLEARGIGLTQVESEVVVPADAVSDKQEYAAATIRRKITRQWLPYLEGHDNPRDFFMGEPTEFHRFSPGQMISGGPGIPSSAGPFPGILPEELRALTAMGQFVDLLRKKGLSVPDDAVPPSEEFVGGSAAAHARLRRFLSETFPSYGEGRNDPATPSQSELSPYLHFGMISPLRVAWEAVLAARELRQNPKLNPSAVPDESLEAFLEELVVRRELAKNFVLHNPDYDRYEGIPAWAKASLDGHRGDPRQTVYTREQLERAETYDPYWNACQKEMLVSGKMHGYMRMYWGKKVIEWSPTPEQAFETLVYLNDTYELDGRDENGYAGISWCFGTHDRGWAERAIFGKIRYMNDRGLERKFRIREYAERWL
jgi:deoxyribodipyrimidine photo-lyase